MKTQLPSLCHPAVCHLFLAALWLTPLAALQGGTPPKRPARPNILLIITDDQGYGDFSLHGNPHLRTPHLDRFAMSGVQFERFLELACACPADDAGSRLRVAVGVNFAEQDIEPAGDDYHAYRLLVSDDGADWRPLVDKSAAKTCTPHDFVELHAAVTARLLKLENVHTPRGGRFALRELRVFGHGHGTPPPPVSNLRIARHTDDDRNVTIRWSPAANADGYLLRFNDCCLQIQGGQTDQLTFHALTRGMKYRWRIDAFNDSGLTAGASMEEK